MKNRWRTSYWYGIVFVVILFSCGVLIYFALSVNNLAIVAEFFGVFLGFMLAYVTGEALRCRREEKEADHILADIETEFKALIEKYDEGNLSAFYSATAPWIRARGLTYAIPRDLRTKLLDALNDFEIFNSLIRNADRYEISPACDIQQLTEMKERARGCEYSRHLPSLLLLRLRTCSLFPYALLLLESSRIINNPSTHSFQVETSTPDSLRVHSQERVIE